MTEFEMPEAALIRHLRERLGEAVADECVVDFIAYLSALGEASYVGAWDDVQRTGRPDAEDVMDRAERRAGTFQCAALMLNSYLANAQPVPVADEVPAWAAETQVLMPLVPA
jgi:hypothetical protein